MKEMSLNSMNKEKVYCSECKHMYTSMIFICCRKTEEIDVPDTFYKRGKASISTIIPELKNKNNDCEFYESRKT